MTAQQATRSLRATAESHEEANAKLSERHSELESRLVVAQADTDRLKYAAAAWLLTTHRCLSEQQHDIAGSTADPGHSPDTAAVIRDFTKHPPCLLRRHCTVLKAGSATCIL